MKKLAYITIFMSALLSSFQVNSATIPIDVVFTEIGDDVKVEFKIQDLAPGLAIINEPASWWITLFEDDILFDDELGMFKLINNNAVRLRLVNTFGGYETNKITHTFVDASNAKTGFGDDYFITVKSHAVSEPITLILVGFGFLGFLLHNRKGNQPLFLS